MAPMPQSSRRWKCSDEKDDGLVPILTLTVFHTDIMLGMAAWGSGIRGTLTARP